MGGEARTMLGGGWAWPGPLWMVAGGGGMAGTMLGGGGVARTTTGRGVARVTLCGGCVAWTTLGGGSGGHSQNYAGQCRARTTYALGKASASCSKPPCE